MQKLPIGEQSFRNLREENRVYVDKTRQIYDLLQTGKFVFLSRPHRFGKSLLTTTLQELFRGNQALFQGLWIEDNITLDPRFATLLGYTQSELEFYFADRLEQLAERYQMTHPAMLALIAHWYNGYSWDGLQTVYVPFSTLVFLEQQIFANHWFATATPSFLIKLLRQKQVPAYELDELSADSKLLDSADVANINVYALLFQTGYLTIKSTWLGPTGQNYDLGYPNYEVAQAFQHHLLSDYLGATFEQMSTSILNRLQKALRTQNVEGFINVLKLVFASIPHTLFLTQEAYYHSLIYLLLKVLGFTIHAEPLTNLGRIDAVVDLSEAVYILEFKMSTAQIALDQIRNKHYDLPYRNQSKPIILLGIAFDPASHNIAEWKMEQVVQASKA